MNLSLFPSTAYLLGVIGSIDRLRFELPVSLGHLLVLNNMVLALEAEADDGEKAAA